MGTLPAPESYPTNIVSAFDCDLVIPALYEEARLGGTIASLHEATTAALLKVRTSSWTTDAWTPAGTAHTPTSTR
jgi:hypothetical protein